MKKFKQPTIKVITTEDLPEGVYMGMSGWVMSNCYTVDWNPTQFPETGRGTWIFQINGHHNTLDPYKPGPHSNHNQYFIFSFTAPCEYAIFEGVVLEWLDSSHTKGRALMPYMQNPRDEIGSGKLELEIVAKDGYVTVSNIEISDVPFRY